jgi:hypothetical protein
MLKAEQKSYTIEELFKNDAFRRFAPFFLDQPRTVLEVEELSGITRQTISNILERGFMVEGGYYDHNYIESPLSKRGKPIRLKPEILTSYLTKEFSFTQDETNTLNELIHNQSIFLTITKDNLTLDMALMKFIMLILYITTYNRISIEDPKYHERTAYLIENLKKAFEKAPPSYTRDLKKAVKNYGNQNLAFGFSYLDKDDLTLWQKEFAKKHTKELEGILSKILNSTFPLVITIKDIHDMMLRIIGGVLLIKSKAGVGTKEWIEFHNRFREDIKNKHKKPKGDDL